MTRRVVRVVLEEKMPSGVDLALKPGANLVNGTAAFRRYFGAPTSLETDLLTVAAAIYAADIGTLRGDREGYARNFDLEVPVVNHHAFNAIKDKLTLCLSLLSSDSWSISFTRIAGSPEEKTQRHEADGDVLLFSGGLDSLAYAVELAETRRPTALVSHDSGNHVTTGAQEALLAHVRSIDDFDGFPHLPFRVRAERRNSWTYTAEKEPSQRTRSFLFMALGALVARRRGARRVLFMAENGQMAIHVPLTAARIGAFSTRTAHPEALSIAQALFSELLDFALAVENPYLYRTKAEVVKNLCKAQHASAVQRSVSCWMGSRVAGSSSHCGACIPCLVRRIALEHWGQTNGTEWARDLLSEDVSTLPEDDDGKRNLVELVDMVTRFSDNVDDTQLCLEYPELMNRHFRLGDAADMYRRFATEARAVLHNYPNVRILM